MTATLGVQMFTLRRYTQDANSLDAALRRVHEIGYRCVQPSAFGDIPAEQVAELCAHQGLEIGGTHVSWERFQGDLDRVIEEHALWQCRHTAVGFIPPATYLSMAGLERFLGELEPIARRLADHGIDFSYHHHAHELRHFEGRPWLAHLLDRTPAEVLKLELDTHWIVAGGGDPVQWIDDWGHRMPLVHLKDFTLDDAYKRNFAPVGAGNLNWPAILAAVAKQPVDYCFVEQDSCYGEDEFDCLRRSHDFLRGCGFDR